jgi:hypothetical protein
MLSHCDGEDELYFAMGVSSGQHNPFSVFPVTQVNPLTPVASATPITHKGTMSTPDDIFVADRPLEKLIRPLVAFPDLPYAERSLFHHYVNHVAALMMPYEHPRNPWKFDYPATALYQVSSNQKALYNAMLAQAAFNLSHLGSKGSEMFSVGSQHYNHALQQLIPQISYEKNDFSAMIASMMTLMFAEVGIDLRNELIKPSS